MLWGARAQIIAGLALVGLAEAALDNELNHIKIGVELIVAPGGGLAGGEGLGQGSP